MQIPKVGGFSSKTTIIFYLCNLVHAPITSPLIGQPCEQCQRCLSRLPTLPKVNGRRPAAPARENERDEVGRALPMCFASLSDDLCRPSFLPVPPPLLELFPANTADATSFKLPFRHAPTPARAFPDHHSRRHLLLQASVYGQPDWR